MGYPSRCLEIDNDSKLNNRCSVDVCGQQNGPSAMEFSGNGL